MSKPGRLPSFLPLRMLRDWDEGREVAVSDLPPNPSPFQHIRTSTHVGLERGRMAAEEGRLFQVQALDFERPRRVDGKGYETEAWCLAVRTASPLKSTLATVGGERGLAWLEEADPDPLSPSEGWVEQFRQVRRLVVTFLTPALFDGGWRPSWLGADGVGEPPGITGLRLRLVAAALGRWEGISGWDLAEWKPKPMRRAVPAGSTYWFDVESRPDDPNWPEHVWLSSWSDSAQDRLDGWGAVLPRSITAQEIES